VLSSFFLELTIMQFELGELPSYDPTSPLDGQPWFLGRRHGAAFDVIGLFCVGPEQADLDYLDTFSSWGGAAVSNATALGVNPSALAATCVAESGCQNVRGSGTVAGAFQMTASTYTAMINVAHVDIAAIDAEDMPEAHGQLSKN
jgi:hypothetical protein